MTRLFLRFYVGVILILVVAWMIQSYVFRTRSAADNIRVVETALSGGIRLAREQLEVNWPEDAEEILAHLNEKFDYEVRIIPESERPVDEATYMRLQGGEEVLVYGVLMATRIGDTDQYLEFGPLPQFIGPSQAEILIGLGVVSMLAALAIAFLLRPVALQLRSVETAATKIAKGDLDARIKTEHWHRRLPLASAFNQMADKTQRLLQSQRELLQAVSHELRTPLARIRFATDLIESAKDDAERRERLAAVDRATVELDHLVGELLHYARAESESTQKTLEVVVIPDLLRGIGSDVGMVNPDLDFQVECEEGMSLLTDRGAVARAIKNLVGNAARYARSCVQMSAAKDKDELVIMVDDDGEGIAVEDRERVFEPFVYLESGASHGTGLGLALVNRIVTGLGGTVQVMDSPSGGARFAIRLKA